uniref:4'-phosphopantetheinyl transferase n=1 Tax=Candidatus Kentrum sp. SD TaxID=2126332 RepID=A0A450YE75_9GAMM|nr:MAG: 4'-phosphopantetheinyl transferase [Candidatus Kentron sp. SD]VFK45289.1 MAG: 4'-phosphopantetheinyl transferase [Candidatus Kentron sp. SD]VFK80525.1 MAG: 4'-phosphopantetheinyl transferase [Candidatus Kentron sp. SD]
MPVPRWSTSPSDLALSKDEVHVWRAPLDLPDIRIGALRETLNEEELQRIGRFRFSRHRRRFTVARGILKGLLAGYLQKPAARIGFEYNQYGKPFLKSDKSAPRARTDDPWDGPIEFNVSHSGEMALYAFSRNRRVGIDLEWTQRGIDDSERIVERFFSPREFAVFSRLPEYQKRTAFFGCWTRKEAYIKARGRGLSIPLDQFEVIPIPGETRCPARCHESEGMSENQDRTTSVIHFLSDIFTLTADNDPQHGVCWEMRTFTAGHDYLASLVVEGQGWGTRYWQWK